MITPQKLNRSEKVVEVSNRFTLRVYQLLDTLIDNLNSIIGLSVDINSSEISYTDSPYTITKNAQTLLCDASGGNIIINLPDGGLSKTYNIIKIDSSVNTVTINATDLIIGAASQVLNAQYDSIVIIGSTGEYYIR